MVTACPTLSPSGWVTDVSGKADSLLAYFFESMKSQTLLYGNNVSSIQYLLQQYGYNLDVLCENIQKTLEQYLNRYYSVATATVSNNASDPTNFGTTAEITIYVSLTDGGITYSIGDLLKISNGKVTAIERINNG